MRVRLILLILFLFSSSVMAHDWYPQSCCGGHDCGPIDGSRVELGPQGGYIVDRKHVVSPQNVQTSQDGQFHACFTPYVPYMPWSLKIRCFFAPKAGM